MKFHHLLPLGAAALFSACAGTLVTDTQTAAVVTERPRAIYIKPFSVEGSDFSGANAGGSGERPIRESLAPAEFSQDLKEELEKLAPTRVLLPDERAPLGWLVEGSLDRVDGGSPSERGVWGLTGSSHIKIHVRVIDVGGTSVASDDKDGGVLRRRGHVIYEFDVEGGSRQSGRHGAVTAPGVGSAAPFDYRNAADRIRAALEPDAHRYGHRSTTDVR